MTVVQAFYGELGWLWGMRGCELSAFVGGDAVSVRGGIGSNVAL